METEELLRQAKRRLVAAYGSRLRSVVLHGSEARGEAGPDSDVDLLVVLDQPVSVGRDLRIIVDALYPLILESGRIIDAVPVETAVYRAAEYELYRAAHEEGVAL